MNALGSKIKVCNTDPMTGWRRDGFCSTDDNDIGTHIVCAKVTSAFLDFTKSRGNNLVSKTPFFPGLKQGDKWCLCILRWIEAYFAGVAPPVDLEATSENVFQYLESAGISKKEFFKFRI
jgi:uncharacterized protein (DUF2237 family)